LSDIRKQYLAGHRLIEESERAQLLGACSGCRIATPGDYDNRQICCRIVLLGEIIEAADPRKM